MSGNGKDMGGILSARERDCLRLLSNGLDTHQAARSCGVTMSTFRKHLASARQKLGVARTSQALLLYQRQFDVTSNTAEEVLAPVEWHNGRAASLSDFAAALDACSTFDEAWATLNRYAGSLGVIYINFGVIAEPPGSVTTGAAMLRSTMPHEIVELYNACGGATTDPSSLHIASSLSDIYFDHENQHALLHLSSLPKAIRELAEAFVENELRFVLCQPGRDGATGAPYALVFALHPEIAGDLRGHRREVVSLLRTMMEVFWIRVQDKSMLVEFAPLKGKQLDALKLAARGFKTAEMAEHMGISRRAVEQALAGARDLFAAPTTAAAIYRAMVYRALS